jgi:mono/diheme cytochrome c family protein
VSTDSGSTALGFLLRLRRSRPVRYVLLVGMLGALLALALIWRPEIAPQAAPLAASFPADRVAQGAVLARLGDCIVCHTAEDGRPFAGGRPLATPFGVLYSNNLTPDRETGLGRWSPEAFRRAMKDGVARNGSHLYPALPYEHFTHVTDEDLDALYAFLMTRQPVREAAPGNKLIPPLGFRPLLAGWKMLFLHKGAVPTDPSRSAEWNRGAYVVEGLAHCGGCHTPRNLAGGEERSRAYHGGIAEGWRAPPLNDTNPAACAWNSEALFKYLRTGLSPNHSAAGGPMGPVVEGLSNAPESDVRAIASYFASKMSSSPKCGPELRPIDQGTVADRDFSTGATIFAGACAGCHGVGAPMAAQERPSLALASDLRDSDPASAIQAVLSGIEPPVADRGPKMPPFAESLDDSQIAAVVAYARARYTDRTPWPHLEHAVHEARDGG